MRALGVIGRILIGAGIVVLLFAAYQVWGTSIQEAHTQSTLRHTFAHQAKTDQLQAALNAATSKDASADRAAAGGADHGATSGG